METINSAIRPILSNHFKPALLARMNIAPFVILNPEIMKDIVTLKLNKLVKRLDETHGMKLICSPEIVGQIASRCVEVETGARNIDHIMNGTIMPKMSEAILARMSEGEMPPEVHLGVEEDGELKIEFKE
jgi:type VI secretion system protein VasG